jgi:hypothetical protein
MPNENELWVSFTLGSDGNYFLRSDEGTCLSSFAPCSLFRVGSERKRVSTRSGLLEALMPSFFRDMLKDYLKCHKETTELLPECMACGRAMIRMEDGTYECDYCCGDPDCELCS